MRSNRVLEQVDAAETVQHHVQDMVNKFGWLPAECRRLEQESLAMAHTPLARAVLHCYCAHWYAACCSKEPVQQHAAFTALHAYLFRTAQYVAIVRYNIAPAYAEQLAADSAQEAILIIWQKKQQVKQPGTFLGWVKLIVTRVVLHKLQGEVDMDSLDSEAEANVEDNQQPTATTPDVASDEAQQVAEEAIRRCLKQIAHQQVIIEHLLNNKTLNQIAELLGRTPSDVRQIKRRALTRLRQCAGMQELMKNQAQQGNAPAQQTDLFRLQQALAGTRDTSLDCAAIETWLPGYIEDEIAGEAVAVKHPDIKRHLDLCPECELLYVELLEVALAEQAGALGASSSSPLPDLSFLPPLPSFVALARDLVNRVTQQALAKLAPGALTDLATLSELFFKRVDALGDQLPTQQMVVATLGPEDPHTSALLTLTASYLTTQQIARTLSREALQSQSRQGSLHATLFQIARQSAEANGLAVADAQAFAQVYADQAVQAPDIWIALIERVR